MKKNILEFWVGLFILLGVSALAILAFRVAGGQGGFSGSRATYTVYAEFADIGGLKVQAPIKTAGVLVGRVKNIELDPQNFQAKVSLELDAQYQFSSDAMAQILTSGLLGEQYIGLTQGGAEEKLGEGQYLENTASALVLENMLNQVVGKFMDSGNKSEATSNETTTQH
ncbi:MAG: outer membrane lipid asymmetry maintenance protein MlaD [Alysiella sp.]|uniref:outer membrane lipid asymmetry maintenance protein MlaD n=1 Tax=Alysiella sp. TaxID=1872483 RepID=UPI0026DD365F|nr:outer membrane lipid asymmetry maintenance protein MlaD [Alysiella sp.]MDO4433196.1 outer membrane lipid asymmetry maintenance protein MlaD [Alysiella sp.]